MKGEMWQYNKFPYLLSLQVENRLKIIFIVREHGKGILQWSFSVGRGQYALERVFRYYYYGSVNALASAPVFSADFVKVKKKKKKKKKIAVL